MYDCHYVTHLLSIMQTGDFKSWGKIKIKEIFYKVWNKNGKLLWDKSKEKLKLEVSLSMIQWMFKKSLYRVAKKPRNSRYSRFFRTLLWSTVIFFPLLDRASFPHYNNTKIIKFGWKCFILWVISYVLSFSGFARFPEFRLMTASAAHAPTHTIIQPATKKSTKPMTCLDCKYLLGNIHGSLNTILAQYMDGRSCH